MLQLINLFITDLGIFFLKSQTLQPIRNEQVKHREIILNYKDK